MQNRLVESFLHQREATGGYGFICGINTNVRITNFVFTFFLLYLPVGRCVVVSVTSWRRGRWLEAPKSRVHFLTAIVMTK